MSSGRQKVFMMVLGTSLANVASAAVDLSNSTLLTYINGAESMSYRIFLPDGYSPTGPKLPVVLYLHSAAERGETADAIFSWIDNNTHQTVHNPWVTQLVNETQHGAHKAILITPETGAWQYWNSINNGDSWAVGNYVNATQPAINVNLQMAIDIVNQTLANKQADANRVYVTGPSMGGYGTWDAMARFPNLLAAAVPLSGGGNTQAAGTIIKNKPVWAFHGVTDSLISVNNTDQLTTAITAAGGHPVYSRVAGLGHEGWDTFYTPNTYKTGSPSVTGGTGQDMYSWMFAQTTAVPEPTSITLLLGFAAGALLRRRQHTRSA